MGLACLAGRGDNRRGRSRWRTEGVESQKRGGGRKGKGVNECVLNDPRLELEVYFSVEIFWAMVFSFHSTYLF